LKSAGLHCGVSAQAEASAAREATWAAKAPLRERRNALLDSMNHLWRKLHASHSFAHKNRIGAQIEAIRLELLSEPLREVLSAERLYELEHVSRVYRRRKRESAAKGAAAPAKLDANEQSKRDRVLKAIGDCAGKDGWAPSVKVYSAAKQRGETAVAFRERLATYPVEIRDNPAGKGLQVRATHH